MASMCKIEELAGQDMSHLSDSVFTQWHASALQHRRATDTIVPAHLGNLRAVEARCDKLYLPLFIVENLSRSVSIAKTYGELFDHENRSDNPRP